MNAVSKKNRYQFIFTLLIVTLSQISFAQTSDSTKKVYHFSGTALITNNGISFIPTFSLGKPATIINLSMGDKRLSFDPEFRFSLEGKPWSILLWGRYKVTNTDRFKFTAGTHLGLSYNTPSATINGTTYEIIQVKRYWAGELVPNYIINKHISVGLYYLFSHGLDAGTTKNTHFLTLNSNITNIPLTKAFFVGLKPQVYYLQMDNLNGYYASATVSLNKTKFPIYVSAIFNQKIQSTIVSNNFVWNLSLNYAFNNNFIHK